MQIGGRGMVGRRGSAKGPSGRGERRVSEAGSEHMLSRRDVACAAPVSRQNVPVPSRGQGRRVTWRAAAGARPRDSQGPGVGGGRAP
jgi:hypothetical protein